MATGSRGDAERRFWDRCQNLRIKQGVMPTAVRWHIQRAEQFILSVSGRRLANLFRQDMDSYPGRLGQDSGLQPQQFRQALDAIRNLHSIVGTEWAIDVDWAFWRDSARTLEEQHATTARQRAPGIPGSVHRYRFLSPIDALPN
ncbi:hypothetical protein [Thioalkalivibrio nitratireducens]|uniref:hypothetical protein n=1 Tax=Thioalkalivibrio nitratireducens TaxID=186931 RepID=UPI000694CA85|nr:hypothetical protein [Thioalkalivibrio nitratireducens]